MIPALSLPGGPAVAARPSPALLGVPFDNLTLSEAVDRVEQMVESRLPHYVVTPNVDFVTQAQDDLELHRILCEADLVLCDGTPLVWASRLLGNPLPERVAGADVVPRLIARAAQKRWKLFLLGATPESCWRAAANLSARYPGLRLGHYSPPFQGLLEMDHDHIKRRIRAARPDLLFVGLGCPKQEKWIAMHYRTLGVPVVAGVGATIDFLAGAVKRAPRWMQRSGMEWVFRLVQEPRRLAHRYGTDLRVFARCFLAQWRQTRPFFFDTVGRRDAGPGHSTAALCLDKPTASDAHISHPIPGVFLVPGGSHPLAERQICPMPARLDFDYVRHRLFPWDNTLAGPCHCVLEMSEVRFVDSTGVGLLLKLRKRLRDSGRLLVLAACGTAVRRVLHLMRLDQFFICAPDLAAADRFLQTLPSGEPEHVQLMGAGRISWHGEITAANVETVWAATLPGLGRPAGTGEVVIDLDGVAFIDSSGLGLMLRARDFVQAQSATLRFINAREVVSTIIRQSRLETLLV